MPDVQVRCTVDNCYFWAHDNFCKADTILITSSQAANKYTQSTENASMASLVSEIGETPAGHSGETACQTFQQH